MNYHGGCQCGAVRYRAEGKRGRASLCFCRMCQKAGGAPFMAFVRFEAARVNWDGEPAVFASSNAVERGFCRECGTPLSYRDVAGPYISLTIHSLDDPSAVQPEISFSSAARPDWCLHLGNLTPLEMDRDEEPGFLSHQR
ncbi:MAG: GFA family protein [Rhodospirillales bacterium]|nr:GFA family protein [Rhodospirillales bacterium]